MEAWSINNGMGSGTLACHQRPDDSYFHAATDVDASKTSTPIFFGIMLSFTIFCDKYSQYLMVYILLTNLLYLIHEYSFWPESAWPKSIGLPYRTVRDVDP